MKHASIRPTIPPTASKTKPERPLTDKLMKRIRRIIENSKGEITITALAKDLGKHYQDVSEYLNGYRSAPNSETTISMIQWCEKHDPKRAISNRKGASI